MALAASIIKNGDTYLVSRRTLHGGGEAAQANDWAA